MDTDKRKFSSNESLKSSAPSFSPIFGTCTDIWHSTPVKKNHVRAPAEPSPPSARLSTGHGTSRSLRVSPEHSAIYRPQRQKVTTGVAVTPGAAVKAGGSVTPVTGNGSMMAGAASGTVTASEAIAAVTESAVLQKQRRELQLLMAELKDRDQELNAMVTAHHKQLQAWEQDRQRVLTLEQRSARLEGELQKRKEVIQALTKQLRIAEARQQDDRAELSATQLQLQQLSQQHLQSSSQCQELEERNQSLNATILELSSQVGRLQAHEEELTAMLSLKDKDVTKATDLIVELSGRFQRLEEALKEQRSREARALKEAQELNRRCREARAESGQLREELGEKTEDIIRLKQENQRLQRELAASGEDESRKDELLQLARSKQDRTESELQCLRQVCENQQNDLQLLQLNLESAQETLLQRGSRASPGSQGDLTSLLLDCPALSPRSGRSPRLTDGPSPYRASPRIVANGDLGPHPRSPDSQTLDGRLSPTSCLQRLLAKSQEMVASLELGSAHILSADHSARSPSCGSAPGRGGREAAQVGTACVDANAHSHPVLNHWDAGGSHFVGGANKTV
ncbi:coiled-coil domain-containing protein 62 isoform X3 [Anguilla anguilla]|uniref:coiled-coil domain-containing protein 62 isoform X3 n=1 Tax=Anguilla anguilla TaxID=7936 RepID=UPI0015A9BAC3|nr:coiled-coil domain-containing protein 62 isoform X3 [Anguilla anguilla]